MSRFLVDVVFVKIDNNKLCLKIKLKNENDDYYFFHPEDQIMCKHIDKFRRIYDFKRYKKASFNLSLSEFNVYFNLERQIFKFKDRELMNEYNYVINFSEFDRTHIFNHYLSCFVCKYVHTKTRSIRKRPKLSLYDKMNLCHDIGMGYSKSALSKKFTVSNKRSENIRII